MVSVAASEGSLPPTTPGDAADTTVGGGDQGKTLLRGRGPADISGDGLYRKRPPQSLATTIASAQARKAGGNPPLSEAGVPVNANSLTAKIFPNSQ